ncbi:hypothetical protein ACS0TY_010182 [Phlomoides rotata]
MSNPRDNWERLVAAVVKRDQIWQLCHAPSISTVSSDTLSDFTESVLNLDDLSVSLPSPVLRTHPSSFPQAILIFREEINEAIEGAEIFKSECAEAGEQVERLCQMLRTVNEFAVSTSRSPDSTFYDRPFNAIAPKVFGCLEKSLTLVKKCRRHNNLLRRVVPTVFTDDFKKLLNLLDSSVGDMTWVLSIYEAGGLGGGGIIGLSPIASNDDPMLVLVWSFISSLCMRPLQDKIEAAYGLASLAQASDGNKLIIFREGGISPLVKLFKDSSSTGGQIAAASALSFLANDPKTVEAIIDEIKFPVIAQALDYSPMKVQIRVANLVAKMAENHPRVVEYLGKDVIRLLVTLLSFELPMDDYMLKLGKQSTHHGNQRNSETPEVKLGLKISCAEALWRLAKGSEWTCRNITDTKGLLCLAKLVETEAGELQYNCLMTIMEITAAAESNADIRRATFRTNTPVAKAVVDQLLRVIKDDDDPRFKIAAIRGIGSLARTFSAREARVIIGPLVEQLSHKNQDVAIEAAISLGKFANPENYLSWEHSKSIIEFKGVPPLMRLLRGNEKAQLHGFILTCYLAIRAGMIDDLGRAGVVNALEGVDSVFVAQHPELQELIPRALYHLGVSR